MPLRARLDSNQRPRHYQGDGTHYLPPSHLTGLTLADEHCHIKLGLYYDRSASLFYIGLAVDITDKLERKFLVFVVFVLAFKEFLA